MPDPVACRILRSHEELFAIRPQWAALLREDPHATPFQSPEWLLPWLTQFGEGPLRTVTICRNGSLIGLLPFYLYTDPSSGRRQLLQIGIATSDYLDGIFAPGCTAADIIPALDLLAAQLDCETLEITQLRDSSPLNAALQAWCPEALQRNSAESTTQRPAVPTAELHAKIRRNLRYYEARATRIGTLEFVIPDAAQWAKHFHALERLHTARWQASGEPGVFADPRVRAWHQDAIPQLLAAGLARFFCLRFNGEIIAVLYTLLDPPRTAGRTLYTYLTAYSPAHADFCPGTLLLGHIIDHAAHDGFSTIDFLRGNEAYKELWHPTRVGTHRFLTSAAGARAETDARLACSV